MTAQSDQACKELNAAMKMDRVAFNHQLSRIIGQFGLRHIEPGVFATNDGGRIRHHKGGTRVDGQQPYEVIK